MAALMTNQYADCKTSWDLNSAGLQFEVIGETPPVNQLMLLSPRVRQQCQILRELELDGTALKANGFRWIIPPDEVYAIESEEREILGLPTPSKIKASVITQRERVERIRRLGLDLRHPEHGVLTGAKRYGGFIAVGGGEFVLMSSELRELDKHLQNGPEVESYESTAAAQQAYHATAQRLARVAGVEVESWLKREEYLFPATIGVTLDGNVDQGLIIHPNAEGVKEEVLQSRLEKSAGKKGVIWVSDGRKRIRMVLSPEQRRIVQDLEKKGKRISPEELGSFIDNPDEFLPEGIDLSEFSKRVKGLKLRVYDSRPYVHIRKDKLKWFPTVSVKLNQETADHSRKGTADEDTPPLDSGDFLEKAKTAMAEGRSHFVHNGAIIRFDPNTVESLSKVEEIAGPRFNGGITGTPNYILDIFENLNALEYSIEAEQIEEEDQQNLVREILSFQQPQILNANLKPFQDVGYRWLRTLDQRKRGGLLADDMGLGKTLQVIGLLAARKEETRSAPSLVVVPKTLIDNWYEEIQRFCPTLRIGNYRGGDVSGQEDFIHYDVVLVTYETLRRNQLHLARTDWRVVICDEAQAIKNPTTGRTTAVKGLKSEMRVAMTGTPVENGLSELWSIMDWVQPGLLNSRQEFRDFFEKPIVGATDDEERTNSVRKLQAKINDHYLRRLKTEVLEGMPKKEVIIERAQLSDLQLNHYISLVEQAREGGRGVMLACLQKLLLLCACPWDDEQLSKAVGSDSELEECPKLRLLFEVLDAVKTSDEKALIFLDRKPVQRMLQNVLFHRYGFAPDLINGDITEGRQGLVNRFNSSSGFNLMILSTRVGGTGLNITSANHVIHYMRPWNPAIENQATDRVYRIGQDKPVSVYVPIATWPNGQDKSVEEVLADLIEAKTQLAENVIIPTARVSLEDDVMKRVFRSKESKTAD